jgi:hypothetical protein
MILVMNDGVVDADVASDDADARGEGVNASQSAAATIVTLCLCWMAMTARVG